MSDHRQRVSPEAACLAEQERLLGDLTDQLANGETEFTETTAEFDRFRQQYLRRFAPLHAELERLESDLDNGPGSRRHPISSILPTPCRPYQSNPRPAGRRWNRPSGPH